MFPRNLRQQKSTNGCKSISEEGLSVEVWLADISDSSHDCVRVSDGSLKLSPYDDEERVNGLSSNSKDKRNRSAS